MEKIKSKIDALVYAIEATKGKMGVDLKKADEVYEMIVSKVTLPDTEEDAGNEMLGSLKGFFDGVAERMPSIVNYLNALHGDADGGDIKEYVIPKE